MSPGPLPASSGRRLSTLHSRALVAQCWSWLELAGASPSLRNARAGGALLACTGCCWPPLIKQTDGWRSWREYTHHLDGVHSNGTLGQLASSRRARRRGLLHRGAWLAGWPGSPPVPLHPGWTKLPYSVLWREKHRREDGRWTVQARRDSVESVLCEAEAAGRTGEAGRRLATTGRGMATRDGRAGTESSGRRQCTFLWAGERCN